ncbi:undecaprenyl-diphosphate phosphatase [Halomarina litorea]|uniref:undecaprenyl-diphosphate phosphatase n=1 Tax=Halomarina litorea TaxID=2961595 RepID=UPI0020C412DD|nr:undecaprenyl-diphosphate phosphatase [Halomarina sp. BCD28]
MDDSLLLALVVGVLQGVFEWLPISSEGQISLYLSVVEGLPAKAATQFSLVLHAGTAVSALVYYRGEVRDVLARIPEWRPATAFERTPELTFLVVATLVSALSGAVAYTVLDELVSALTGGAFVALVGALLVGTGVLQRVATGALGTRETPTAGDALLVGVLQGLAVLPGVSRSGTTAGALLLRGHDGPSSFRLSFLLSIPAAAGAGVLVLLSEGLPALTPTATAVALATSAVVGYLTIDALMRVVERVAFWGVCIALGALALLGGLLLVLGGA